MRCLLVAVGAVGLTTAHAQDVRMAPTPEMAAAEYARQVPQFYGHCTDSLRMDTIYTENLDTGDLEMQVQTFPFARFEYYLDGALYRRIDIKQVDDTREVGWRQDIGTGDTIGMLSTVLVDIPNGVYHEFFPNGNIRVMGTLDGYGNDGTPRRTGEWRTWDADGVVIKREQLP